MGMVSAAFFYSCSRSVSDNVLAGLVGSVGLMVAFYYGVTGFACVWYYRKTLLNRQYPVHAWRRPATGWPIARRVVGLLQYAKPD